MLREISLCPRPPACTPAGKWFMMYAYDHCLEWHRQKHTWMGEPADARGLAGAAWACPLAGTLATRALLSQH